MPVFHIYLERMTGIEPASPAWEAGILPLNHIRAMCLRDVSRSAGNIYYTI
jgi:hypothetical protein